MRAGSVDVGSARTLKPGDCRRALDQRGHYQNARRQPALETASERPHPGRHLRSTAPPGTFRGCIITVTMQQTTISAILRGF